MSIMLKLFRKVAKTQKASFNSLAAIISLLALL